MDQGSRTVCASCVEVCPVDCIHTEDEVPGEWQQFIALRADYFRKE